MKKIVLLAFTFASLVAGAQNLKLETGKTFKLTMTADGTVEMMGNENANKSTIISNIKITGLEKDLYTGTTTVTKKTMSGSMMGQDMSFDSDKKEDMDGQMGQFLGNDINKEIKVTVDKNTGVSKVVSEESDGGMGKMMGGGSTNISIFYPGAIGKKAGDKWTENAEEDGIKTITNYEVKSVNGNVITLAASSTTKGSTSKEMNGQSMDLAIDSKSTSTLIIDGLTGILKQSTTELEMTTSIEGPQSMVIGNKSKNTLVVE